MLNNLHKEYSNNMTFYPYNIKKWNTQRNRCTPTLNLEKLHYLCEWKFNEGAVLFRCAYWIVTDYFITYLQEPNWVCQCTGKHGRQNHKQFHGEFLTGSSFHHFCLYSKQSHLMGDSSLISLSVALCLKKGAERAVSSWSDWDLITQCTDLLQY